MTKQDTIVGYTYQIENLCSRCTLKRMSGDHWDDSLPPANAENVLNFCAPFYRIDRTDESSFDQADFPKVLFYSDVDALSHCNNCGANFQEEA